MAKEVKITCDGCGCDLTTTENVVGYRVALVVEGIQPRDEQS
jgi:hypothetical protein